MIGIYRRGVDVPSHGVLVVTLVPDPQRVLSFGRLFVGDIKLPFEILYIDPEAVCRITYPIVDVVLEALPKEGLGGLDQTPSPPAALAISSTPQPRSTSQRRIVAVYWVIKVLPEKKYKY